MISKFRHVTIGYVLPQHKKKHLEGIKNTKLYPSKYYFSLVPIDPTLPLKDQAKCDIIIHKVHDFLTVEKNITDKEKLCLLIENFCLQTKMFKVTLIDPWYGIHLLLNRLDLSMILNDNSTIINNITIKSPPTALVDKEMSDDEFLFLMDKNGLDFPFMTKPEGGLLPRFRYEMSLHFGSHPSKYERITDQFKDYIPCVIQQFYNHGGLLYKLYVIGDFWKIIVRPSIIDLDFNRTEPIYFKSSSISRKFSEGCELTSCLDGKQIIDDRSCGLDSEAVASMVKNIRTSLNLDLFGADLIVDTSNQTYYVVDVNYFPGYKGISDLDEKFVDLFVKFVEQPF